MFQAGIIKLCSRDVGSGSNVEERIEKIENYLKSGRVVTQTAPTQVSGTSLNNSVMQKANITEPSSTNKNIVATASMQSNTRTSNTSSKSYSSDLSKSWPKIVNDLKQNGKIVLYTNLMNTRAEQINDATVGIKFPKGITSFGKAVLEKQENIKEISNLVSMACGKEVQIKYISDIQNQAVKHSPEEDIQKLANDSDIPFNIIE